MFMMEGFGVLMGLFSLMMYVAIPVVTIFFIIWIYRIKQNSDMQVEQNKEIIQLLQKLDK